jgi:hypothetical protein
MSRIWTLVADRHHLNADPDPAFSLTIAISDPNISIPDPGSNVTGSLIRIRNKEYN